MMNVILFSCLFINIYTGGLRDSVSCFLLIYPKLSWISDTEYDPSGNSNLSFDGGAEILNLLFFITFLYFYMYIRC